MMPYQLAPNKFLVPYYVMTVDANTIYDQKKDPLDPERYDMPEQDFDVTIGNCAGIGAKVSGYDPVSNVTVPVAVVEATANTLTVRVKARDYPRILQITEANAGPQILDPKAAADAAGNLTVNFRTNQPAGAVRITYGRDWMNRGAKEVAVPGGKSAYEVKIPTGMKGVIAVRVRVASNGLSNVWPRWDEDVQGQVVVPGSTLADVKPAKPTGPSATTVSAAEPEPLTEPAGIPLGTSVKNASYGYSLILPQGVSPTGPDGDWEAVLGTGPKSLRVRGRYFAGGVESAADAMPFAAVGDEKLERAVVLPAGDKGTLVKFRLAEALHPGMTNLGQTYLIVPLPKANKGVVLLSMQGTVEAMQGQEALVKAVLGSFRVGE